MTLVKAPAALIDGYSAWLFAQLLRKQLLGAKVEHLDARRREEAFESLEALEQAGNAWRQLVASAFAEATEPAEVPSDARRPDLVQPMKSAEVAGVLGVTDRYVREIAPRLGAVKRRGAWEFPRDEVLAFQQERSA